MSQAVANRPAEAGSYEAEVASGKRFEFGKNWQHFLAYLNEDRIVAATADLRKMLGVEDLKGKSFIDIGSGSGLHSVAAMRLGADRVFSFDFDPNSVACTSEVKRRYFPQADNWTVDRGSVLDKAYLSRLGQFDVVYSWGVLHQTGNMWLALENVRGLVKEGGLLFISIYNDQGGASNRWRRIKALHNKGTAGRWLVRGTLVPFMIGRESVVSLLQGRNPLANYRTGARKRGMARIPDLLDWLGGYPHEVAKPEQIFDFYHKQGFNLERLFTCRGSYGCNEFVFSRE